jgi:D-isomer specific 2-hydroxyacid dehydrogenase, NAD binding domain
MDPWTFRPSGRKRFASERSARRRPSESWATGCGAAKTEFPPRQPNLFPAFPGSTILGPFRCTFEVGDRHVRTLSPGTISRIVSEKDDNAAVALAVEAFTNEVRDLVELDQPPQVVICALPVEIIERVSNMRSSPAADRGEDDGGDAADVEDAPVLDREAENFRGALKAATLALRISELGGPRDLDRFLPDSDFVVICCQWTPETTRLFDKDRFTAMKAGSVLINVARGEIIDEEALADALRRDHLRGVALDVYVGEFEHPPMARLWSDPRVLITPHISGASDQNRHGAINVFCANLRAYLDGRPLRNVVDWERGY